MKVTLYDSDGSVLAQCEKFPSLIKVDVNPEISEGVGTLEIRFTGPELHIIGHIRIIGEAAPFLRVTSPEGTVAIEIKVEGETSPIPLQLTGDSDGSQA